jgi:TRAP-type uncharacterized transport system substrate-binding protein
MKKPTRRVALIWLGAALLALLVFAAAQLIGPAPPDRVRIAGGAPGGAYAAAAETLAQALREVGVEAEVVATGGSAENLARLTATDNTAVDIALVQSGVAGPAPPAEVTTLGALFVEPIWMFVRDGAGDAAAPDVQRLRGLRVAAGAPGSGARLVAEDLLEQNGLQGVVTLLPEGGRDAVAALREGRADAAIVVAAAEAEWVRDLVAMRQFTLAPFERADGYARRRPHLAAVTLHRGVLDPAQDLPRTDTPMLAATAQLVVREGLHPAIQSVLLQGASLAFGRGDAVSAPEAFPNPRAVDIALSPEAARFYENGPSALRRYMPYWAANIIERAWLLLLPAAVLLSPLIRSAPPIYRWRTRRRIYVWYRDLRALELQGRGVQSQEEAADIQSRLRALQTEVGQMHVPTAYTDELFRLREHIVFVEGLVRERAADL